MSHLARFRLLLLGSLLPLTFATGCEPDTCVDLAERRIELDPAGPRTQIHAEARWDGRGIWVTYSRPEENGNFDIWATRVDCAGEPLVEPFLAQSAPEGNQIDPSAAFSGDAMLLLWTNDDGMGGTDNLQIFTRAFDRDGTPRGDDTVLRTTHMGAPILDNHTNGSIWVRPGGGFVIAGVRAHPTNMRFAAFAQTVDARGELDGEALDAQIEPMFTQLTAGAAVDSRGETWIAYVHGPDDSMQPNHVRIRRSTTGETELALSDADASGASSIFATDENVWVAMAATRGGETDISVVDVTQPLSARVPLTFGEPGRFEHSPRIAQAADGSLAIAWYRQTSGFSNELLVARLTPGAPPSLGTAVMVEAMEVPAYAPTITHVRDDYWFLSYSVGGSPDFRLIGRFVELPSR